MSFNILGNEPNNKQENRHTDEVTFLYNILVSL